MEPKRLKDVKVPFKSLKELRDEAPPHHGQYDHSVYVASRKKLYTEKLTEYLSNPDNKPPRKKVEWKRLLGMANTETLHHYFSSIELAELENNALQKRRTRYARKLARVDDGLLEKAMKGNAPEVKLVYQRFEGWTEKTVTEVTNTLNLQLDDELMALLEPIKYKGVMDVIPEAETSLLPETFSDSRSQE